tara:strand:- start:7 stop:375 length:369 start_codon:yes stop_codon:yes gene_type:complete
MGELGFDASNYIDNALTEAEQEQLKSHVKHNNPQSHMLKGFDDCLIGFAVDEVEQEQELPDLVYSSRAIFMKLVVLQRMNYPDAMVHLCDMMENTYGMFGSPLFINDLELDDPEGELNEEGD